MRDDDAADAALAFNSVCDDLPRAFIDRDLVFPSWLAALESGDPGQVKRLVPLLPSAELWPDPATVFICDQGWGGPFSDETFPELFLRTVAFQFSALMRARRELATRSAFPFARFAAMGGRSHPDHMSCDGITLPVEHPWWSTHTPPIGWGCMCSRLILNQRQLDREGWTVTTSPLP